MKKLNILPSGPRGLLACAALGFMAASGTSSGQTLVSPTVQDGGFESITSGQFLFASPASAAGNVPYWGATGFGYNAAGVLVAGATVTDSGAVNQGAGGNTVQEGTAGAFFKFTDSTVFNLVNSYVIKAGDQFTLTWYANTTGATLSTQVVTLFSQPTETGATYLYNPTATLATTAGKVGYALDPVVDFTAYSLTYTATSDDAGKSIGITFGNGGAGMGNADTANTFITADNFVLSVTSAVPEPSVLGLGAGAGALLLARRRRRRLA